MSTGLHSLCREVLRYLEGKKNSSPQIKGQKSCDSQEMVLL